MSMKEAYAKKLQAKLDLWDAEFMKLKAKANEARGEAELQYEKQIQALSAQQMAAQEKLDELRRSSDDAWQDLKSGVEGASQSFGEGLKSAIGRFE